MNEFTSPAPSPAVAESPRRNLWHEIPGAWKAAVVLGVLGFWFTFGETSKRTVNGVVVSCDGLDYAPFITGGAVALLAVVGYRALQPYPTLGLDRGTRIALVVVVALAAVHLGRGLLDPAGSFC